MFKYMYEVPEEKKLRLIIHTDAKNEADDQYAIVHQLLTTKLDVRGIIAGHFEVGQNRFAAGTTAEESYREIIKVLRLMDVLDEYKNRVYMGASEGLPDSAKPLISDGARFIVEEALRDDSRPLFIGMQGAITDLACAILIEPEICSRMTCIWIGGGVYPQGGCEFNLSQDVTAANIVFSSAMPVWQIPMNVYKQFAVTLAELQLKVQPYGKIGDYLFRQMVEFNLMCAGNANWPHGETWGLGDQGVISALLDELEKTDGFTTRPAPQFDPVTMRYIDAPENREIRIYHHMNARQTLEDFFAKLQIQYPKTGSCL